MTDHLTKAEKVLARIDQLAAISENAAGITRTFGTNAFVRGSKLVYDWMQQAGLQTRIDNVGNVRGKLLSTNPAAKTFVIGSHIDTVVNAGKFDGPLGVLVGLSLLENLRETKAELPFNIELVAFCDEEGVRFHTTYLGSKVVAGSFDQTLLEKTDKDGRSLQKVLRDMGANPALLVDDALAQDQLLGYYEIHIEQGPVLWERNIPVGLVTAIAGQRRIQLIFKGVAGHAGTVPMHMRNDALTCAAEFVLAVEKYALEHKETIVATIGRLDIPNSASNVIPGEVVCSVDLRSSSEYELGLAYGQLQALGNSIAESRNIQLDWNLVQGTVPVTCSEKQNELLKQAVEDSGYELIELVSGAGHDAVPLSAIMPVSMLFVRCFKGISHNPLENAELADIAAAIRVSEKFLEKMVDGQRSIDNSP